MTPGISLLFACGSDFESHINVTTKKRKKAAVYENIIKTHFIDLPKYLA
jgi:hypothetical protein